MIDPELGGNIVDLGMATGVDRRRPGRATSTIGVKLTIAGCPLRAQIKKDVETRIADPSRACATCTIDWGEMTARRALAR